jgi:uncharacterized membrane protein
MPTTGESHRLEHLVHRTLLTGLLIGASLLALGLALTFIDKSPHTGPPPTLRLVFQGALRGRSAAVLDLGILALVATPILRVAVLAVGWWQAGDRRFAAVALIVLGLLGLSMALGVR